MVGEVGVYKLDIISTYQLWYYQLYCNHSFLCISVNQKDCLALISTSLMGVVEVSFFYYLLFSCLDILGFWGLSQVIICLDQTVTFYWATFDNYRVVSEIFSTLLIFLFLLRCDILSLSYLMMNHTLVRSFDYDYTASYLVIIFKMVSFPPHVLPLTLVLYIYMVLQYVPLFSYLFIFFLYPWTIYFYYIHFLHSSFAHWLVIYVLFFSS